MKKRRAEIIIAIVAVAFFIIMAMYSSLEGSRQYPDYTVFSSKEYGASLIYDSLAIYGINVKTGYNRIDRSTSTKEVHILINPFRQYFFERDISDIGSFLEKGGRVILADDSRAELMLAELEISETDLVSANYKSLLFSHGDGLIMLLKASDILNGHLKGDRLAGDEVAKVLRLWDYDAAVFNEYYHGFADEGSSMWKDLPFAYKLAVYQLVIVFIFFILSVSKRFGKPVPLYEEVERTENEYIYAMANLFRSSKNYHSAAESYYRRFLEQAGIQFKTGFPYARDHIKELWQKENLPGLELLNTVTHEFSTEFDKKRLKAFVKDINKLINILKEGA